MKKMIACMLSVVLMSSGCTSIVNKSIRPVNLNSSPSGANVTIKDSKGVEINRVVTPSTVYLKSLAGYYRPAYYTFLFEKEGYLSMTIDTKAKNIFVRAFNSYTSAEWSMPDHLTASMSTDANYVKPSVAAEEPAEAKVPVLASNNSSPSVDPSIEAARKPLPPAVASVAVSNGEKPPVNQTGEVAREPLPAAAPLPLDKVANLTLVVKSNSQTRCYALVIGVNEYPHLQELKTAVDDAQAVASVLKDRYGFTVAVLTNPVRTEVLVALETWHQKVRETDDFVLFFAGHGKLDTERDSAYWLPSDASAEDTSNWLPVSEITATIRAMRAQHILVIADCCFSGKLTRGIKLVPMTRDPSYYEVLARKKTRIALTSGGDEPVLDAGGEGAHSVFASALLRVLRTNASPLQGMTLFGKVRDHVKLNSDQTPRYEDIHNANADPDGDFVFFPVESTLPQPVTASTPALR